MHFYILNHLRNLNLFEKMIRNILHLPNRSISIGK